MDVKGHAAVVTGGGSGMGAETARHLAAAGAKVAVFDVNMDGAGAVAKEIGGIAVECNVADGASAEAAFATAREANGAARVLINCAGVGAGGLIVGKDGPMALETFTRVIDINLNGTFNCMRLAAADMIELDPLDEDERGIIVSTASVAAMEGQIGQAAYSASKGGIAALMSPAAREFARHGIRVLTIAPGFIDTPMMAGLPEKVHDALMQTLLYPKRLGRPDEFARLILHIIGNVILNNDLIRLDGGIRMPPR